MPQFYLMRHGHSQANAKDLIVSDPAIGTKLYGLTDQGRTEVERSIAESSLGSDTAVVCSDFKRTRETASLVVNYLKSGEPQLEPGLRERFFGQLEGSSGGLYREVWARDSEDPDHSRHGAESPRHLALRLSRTLEKLREQYAETDNVLLVSHGDTLRFLQLVANGLPLTDHMKIVHFRPAEIRRLDELQFTD